MKHIYRIGSFNWCNLSKHHFNDKVPRYKGFEIIADLIRREELDIVCFQEILSEGKPIYDLVDHYLPNWEKKWVPSKDSSDHSKNKDNRGEGYAVIWNGKRIKKADGGTPIGAKSFEPTVLDDGKYRFFSRIPMYARLIPKNGGFFEFRLVNVHIHFGDNTPSEIDKRKAEYDCFVKQIYPDISMKRKYGNNRAAYTIAMGDYNLNIRREYPDGMGVNILPNTYIEDEYISTQQVIRTLQTELTSVKNDGYSQNYDHFTVDIKKLRESGISWKVERVDAVSNYCNGSFEEYTTSVSDHVPIIMELQIGSDEVISTGLNYKKHNWTTPGIISDTDEKREGGR